MYSLFSDARSRRFGMSKRSIVIVIACLALASLVLFARMNETTDERAPAVAMTPSAAESDAPTQRQRLEAPSDPAANRRAARSSNDRGSSGSATIDRSASTSATIDASTLVLELVDEHAMPVAGAHVVVELFRNAGVGAEVINGEYLAGLPRRVQRLEASSDERGRVELALDHDLASAAHATIVAQRSPDLASVAGISLDPPLAGAPHRIELVPTAQLRVHVKGPNGEPVAGIDVEASASSGFPREPIARATSDSNGDVVFARLPRGLYWIDALGMRARDSGTSIMLHDGGATVELEVHGASFGRAVAGVVLDEEGQPLANVGVSFRSMPDGRSASSWTRADGKFEYSSDPSESVEVRVVPALDADEFVPARVEVPFGTENVVLRRARKLAQLDALVKLIGAEDRVPIHGSYAIASAKNASAGIQHGDGDVLRVRCKLRSDWIVTFRAQDRRSVAMTLDDLAHRAGDQRTIEIALSKGFEEDIMVRDADTLEPLAGALFTSADGASSASDAHGRIELRATSWPQSMRIERDGYFAFEWTPSAGFQGEIHLVRLPK